MEKRQQFFRLLIILFTLAVSVPLFPCETVIIHGVFGVIQVSAVVNDSGEDVSEIASRLTECIRVKGASIFNIWLLIAAAIVCLAFAVCAFHLPGEDTIVAKKIRMNN